MSDPKRANGLAAMHMAQKALGLSHEDAQALKLGLTGKASGADMTDAERRKVLAHMARLQGLQVGSPTAVYTPVRRSLARSGADPLDARWGKARALWATLAKAGAVAQDTDAALAAYAARQTKASAWRFLNHHQINTVIESLKRWCERAELAAAAAAAASEAEAARQRD